MKEFLHSQGFTQIISRFSLMTDWESCHLEKEFYHQMLDLAEYYLDNPNIEPCEFFSYDISWTLADESFDALCNIGNCRAFDFQTRKYYPCHMCFPSVCGEEKSRELEHMEMKECNEEKEKSCIGCPFINICKTCYAENFIVRGSVSRRDTSLCAYQKIVFVVLFKYEYARIIKMESPTAHDVQKMMAIQKWYPVIKNMEKQLENE